MESAIPTELKCPRSVAMRMTEGYEPPSPAWTSRWPAGTSQVVMAYLGVQCPDASRTGEALEAAAEMARQLQVPGGSSHQDMLHYVDEAGYPTYVVVAYWSDPQAFAQWQESGPVRSWWDSPARSQGGLGFFREVYRPAVSDFETLTSTLLSREGVAHLGENFSGEVREHAYWGGARDRLPASQTSGLQAEGTLRRTKGAADGRTRVSGHANLTLIRSGQNWQETSGQERSFYLNKLEPVLRRGMDFLRDEGVTEGCYFNRYMRHVDASGEPVEKSFGLSAWRSLAHLEQWAESHPTHKAIFGSFLNMLESKAAPPDLRLYHEVSVLQAEDQYFEYINCHERTGLLKAAAVE